MPLTGDGHVHSEWSWDTGGPRSAAAGRMGAMCRRALKIGLPALAFGRPRVSGRGPANARRLGHVRSVVAH